VRKVTLQKDMPEPYVLLCCCGRCVSLFRDRGIRQRLTAGMPVADLEEVAVTASRARPAQLIRPLQPAAAAVTAAASGRRTSPVPLADPSLPPVVVVPDAEVPLPDIVAALQRLPRQVYVLLMPPLKQMAQLRTVASLAELFCQAIRSTVPPGPLVLAGVGAGGVVAHEMAVQMQRAGHQVSRLQSMLVAIFVCQESGLSFVSQASKSCSPRLRLSPAGACPAVARECAPA
jgi:hypothetical protein